MGTLKGLKEGEKAAVHSIIHHIILGFVKLAVGLLTGMTVIIADAISTFADILAVFAAYLGLRLSRRSANQKFEYGYYKIETFMALIISLLIIYLGYEVIVDSLETFKTPEEGQYRYVAIGLTVFAIIHSYHMSLKMKEAGIKANSLALIATSRNKKLDAIGGVAILISIFSNYQGWPYVEGVVSLIISAIILKDGLFTAKESIFFLLDYWNDPILTKKIRNIFEQEKKLIKLKKLRLRRAGTFIFGEAFVEVNPFTGIQDLREELNFLEEKVHDLNPYIKDFSIFSHITKSQKVKVALPIEHGKDLDAEIANSLKKTTAYLFAEIHNGEVKDFYIKKITKADKKPVAIANFLKNEKVNILIDNDLNSLVYYNLRRIHQILIYPNFSDVKKVSATIKLLLIDT